MIKLAKAVALTCLSLISTNSMAAAPNISPHRAILDSSHRIVTFKVTNNSDENRSYEISLIDREQTSNSTTLLTKNYALSAAKHLRLSPRKRVKIKGRTSKNVRIKVRNLNNLPEGEYRSYLKVTPIVEPSATNQVAINTSIEVPVIVRKGELKSEITVNGTYTGTEFIQHLTYKGSKSFYGTYEIIQEDQVKFKAAGIAYYPESTDIEQTFKVDLDPTKPISVIFKENKGSGDYELLKTIQPANVRLAEQ